jgi:hypothetical protein
LGNFHFVAARYNHHAAFACGNFIPYRNRVA